MIATGFDETVLDPGIRDVVMRLRAEGFHTTDSGDGVSKPAEARVFDVPHVAVSTSPSRLFGDAERIGRMLGTDWRIEASYCPNDGSAIVLAMRGPYQDSAEAAQVAVLARELQFREASQEGQMAAALRATNTRLNRRCTLLEAAVRQMWDACRVAGVRLSRRHGRAHAIVLEMEAGLLETARDKPAGEVAAAAYRHRLHSKVNSR